MTFLHLSFKLPLKYTGWLQPPIWWDWIIRVMSTCNKTILPDNRAMVTAYGAPCFPSTVIQKSHGESVIASATSCADPDKEQWEEKPSQSCSRHQTKSYVGIKNVCTTKKLNLFAIGAQNLVFWFNVFILFVCCSIYSTVRSILSCKFLLIFC